MSEKQLVGSDTIAQFVGVTQRHIQQFTQDGIITPDNPKEKNKQYDFVPTIRALLLHYREEAQKKARGQTSDEMEAAKLRDAEAKAELQELKLAELRGDVHKSEHIERVFGGMLGRLRSSLLSLPQGIAPLLVEKSDINEIAELIDERMNVMLAELSEYDFADFNRDGGGKNGSG